MWLTSLYAMQARYLVITPRRRRPPPCGSPRSTPCRHTLSLSLSLTLTLTPTPTLTLYATQRCYSLVRGYELGATGPSSNPKPSSNPNPNPNPDPNPNPNPNLRAGRFDNFAFDYVVRHRSMVTKLGLGLGLGLRLGSIRSKVKLRPWAVPQLGSCASSGRNWRLWAAQHSQEEARPTGRPAIASGARASRLRSRPFLTTF